MCFKCIKLLIDNGASTYPVDAKGRNVLHWAAKAQKLSIMYYLIEKSMWFFCWALEDKKKQWAHKKMEEKF